MPNVLCFLSSWPCWKLSVVSIRSTSFGSWRALNTKGTHVWPLKGWTWICTSCSTTVLATRSLWRKSNPSHNRYVDVIYDELFTPTSFKLSIFSCSNFIYLLSLQLLSALKSLKTVGVTHTDINPQNIMLTIENDQLRVKIIDFGSAVVSAKVKRGVVMQAAAFRWVFVFQLSLVVCFFVFKSHHWYVKHSKMKTLVFHPQVSWSYSGPSHHRGSRHVVFGWCFGNHVPWQPVIPSKMHDLSSK